ncbi:basic secretory family protein [Sinomicrobium kalidii]|uniref:basic secretory family protein n=1 Tax=Sinomicrobium kalidii TaxID=2900738 RepID=UPI001E519728|nr:basic secretory family protein [Sinomicrobium kalidii]UGU15696.1 basic secretory family protein [Sinomicrobium kalidii]
MRKIICIAVLMVTMVPALAQNREVIRKKGKTLIFTNDDPGLKKEVRSGLIKNFFKVYPKLVRDFNPRATDTVRVKIDTAYNGVAYAHNGKVTISSRWLEKKPGDTDVITHEVMHLVQAYPPDSGPGWLTEGIADYVRYVYGVDNEKAGWSLPAYEPGHHYENSYRITARFLVWLTENRNKDIVPLLDEHMRNKTYSPELWKTYTSKSLDDLWTMYQASPEL